jgi:hypothetical protein
MIYSSKRDIDVTFPELNNKRQFELKFFLTPTNPMFTYCSTFLCSSHCLCCNKLASCRMRYRLNFAHSITLHVVIQVETAKLRWCIIQVSVSDMGQVQKVVSGKK